MLVALCWDHCHSAQVRKDFLSWAWVDLKWPVSKILWLKVRAPLCRVTIVQFPNCSFRLPVGALDGPGSAVDSDIVSQEHLHQRFFQSSKFCVWEPGFENLFWFGNLASELVRWEPLQTVLKTFLGETAVGSMEDLCKSIFQKFLRVWNKSVLFSTSFVSCRSVSTGVFSKSLSSKRMSPKMSRQSVSTWASCGWQESNDTWARRNESKIACEIDYEVAAAFKHSRPLEMFRSFIQPGSIIYVCVCTQVDSKADYERFSATSESPVQRTPSLFSEHPQSPWRMMTFLHLIISKFRAVFSSNFTLLDQMEFPDFVKKSETAKRLWINLRHIISQQRQLWIVHVWNFRPYIWRCLGGGPTVGSWFVHSLCGLVHKYTPQPSRNDEFQQKKTIYY